MGWGSSTQPTMFLIRGRFFRKPVEIADELQKYYIGKITNLIRGLKKGGRDPLRYLNMALQRWQGHANLPTFFLRVISELETLGFIKKLGNTTAHGRDELDALIVKTAAGLLARPLTHIINVSIRTNLFTSKWKLARIILILKSREASRLDPASFRPVSLLPVTSKLVERSVQTQLQQQMEHRGLLHMNSHTYRKNLSTSTALLQLVNELHCAIDKNLISQLLALDQKVAFDCISHPILLRNLRSYGCSTKTITWMQNYLDYRSQYISVGRHNSKIVATCRGVPHCSILGPLLYLLYKNEINEVVNDPNCTDTAHEDATTLFGKNCNSCGKIVTYAENTTYHIVNKHRNQNQLKITENMKKLEEFLNDNDLMINAEKTAIMEAMIKQKRGHTLGEPPHLEVLTEEGNIKIINHKKEMIILGTNLENNMSWMSHLERVNKVILPATRKLFGSLQLIGKMLPRESKKLLAEGLLINKLVYVISQWG